MLATSSEHNWIVVTFKCKLLALVKLREVNKINPKPKPNLNSSFEVNLNEDRRSLQRGGFMGRLTAYWCNLQNKSYVPKIQREWFRRNFITLRRSLTTAQHKRTSLLNSESSCFIYLYFITFFDRGNFY